jgi:hypothetical protein
MISSYKFLNLLPDDLIHEIFDKLTTDDLNSLRRVSKYHQHLLNLGVISGIVPLSISFNELDFMAVDYLKISSYCMPPNFTEMFKNSNYKNFGILNSIKIIYVNLDLLNNIYNWNGIVPDNFLFQINMQKIIFYECKNIKIIGNNFLYGCESLEYFDTTELSSVEKIKRGFLAYCKSLTHFDTTSLSSVTSIGHEFLYRCKRLKYIETSGLSKIKKINANFLCDCCSLEYINTKNFSSVIEIDDNFLSGCYSLRKIDESFLTGVKSIGYKFLHNCNSLTSFDVSKLSSLNIPKIYYFESYRHLHYTDYHGICLPFLFGCKSLQKSDFTALILLYKEFKIEAEYVKDFINDNKELSLKEKHELYLMLFDEIEETPIIKKDDVKKQEIKKTDIRKKEIKKDEKLSCGCVIS